MDRVSKQRYLGNISVAFSSFDFLVIADFSSMTAADSFALRRELKSVKAGVIVAKNTLARIALMKVGGLSCLSDKFIGPTLLFYSNDVISMSRVVSSYLKKSSDKFSVRCAAYKGELLAANDVARLSSLQSLDGARLQLMRLMVLNISARLVCCLRSIKEVE